MLPLEVAVQQRWDYIRRPFCCYKADISFFSSSNVVTTLPNIMTFHVSAKTTAVTHYIFAESSLLLMQSVFLAELCSYKAFSRKWLFDPKWKFRVRGVKDFVWRFLLVTVALCPGKFTKPYYWRHPKSVPYNIGWRSNLVWEASFREDLQAGNSYPMIVAVLNLRWRVKVNHQRRRRSGYLVYHEALCFVNIITSK